jgi:hypothetical protein
MEEMGYQRRSGMVSDNQAKELGAQLGADFVAVSRILKEDGATNITIAIINVETGRKETRNALLESNSPNAIVAKTEELAASLVGLVTPREIQTQEQNKRDEEERIRKEKDERSANRWNAFGKIGSAIATGVTSGGDKSGGRDSHNDRHNDRNNGKNNSSGGQVLTGTVRNTLVKYEIRVMDDGQVRIRFSSIGVSRGARIDWQLDSATNIQNPSSRELMSSYTTVKANTNVDIYRRVIDISKPVNLGSFLVNDVSDYDR